MGKRVSVRRLSEPGAAQEKFTDTVGVLTSWDGGVLMITRRDGRSVRIAESALVAGKVVPAAPARRRGPAASYEELARVCSRGWRPLETERLGEWELRASGGFTRRANSVLPLGDPGLPLDAALAAVRRWYGERGLPAYVQTATGAEGTQELLCAELERRGWVREVTAEVWTGALAPVADRAEGTGVALSRQADEAWLARYRRKGVSEVALRVLGGGPSVWFATVPGAGGEAPAAIGRCVVDGRWAGFAAVEVDPGRRRQGLATEVMAALARRALDEGASAAWLQVETDNEGARALYTALDFTPHFTYHHYREPDAATPEEQQEETGGSTDRHRGRPTKAPAGIQPPADRDTATGTPGGRSHATPPTDRQAEGHAQAAQGLGRTTGPGASAVGRWSHIAETVGRQDPGVGRDGGEEADDSGPVGS
ncbi:acetyltransferase (GNAT) family protein [Streptomyces puniciscabiei]|uniref:Acetyltransferase (GNAT) family protein n=1 Tax=Streptomyces puniciscabiei TaxID=164348 RepID=A0A542UCF6_9ACTN|nr:acetyltransferase (GNAT) family protein [Streptomyces puniciscabiei]